MASRTEEMVRHLKALQMNTPDIEASAVVSVDGLIMASALPADVEEDRVLGSGPAEVYRRVCSALPSRLEAAAACRRTSFS